MSFFFSATGSVVREGIALDSEMVGKLPKHELVKALELSPQPKGARIRVKGKAMEGWLSLKTMRLLSQARDESDGFAPKGGIPEPVVADDGGVLSSGDPSRPAVIFIHSGATSRLSFLPQVEGLADEFHCLSVDLDAHGARARGGSLEEEPYSMDRSVALLIEIVTGRCAGGSALFAGISLGGYTAMELARRRPDLVRGMMLSGCTGDFTKDSSGFASAVASASTMYGRLAEREAANKHAGIMKLDQRASSDPHVNALREHQWRRCIAGPLSHPELVTAFLGDLYARTDVYLSGLASPGAGPVHF